MVRASIRQSATRSTLRYVATDEAREAYREAYDYWQQQLQRLHAFFLEGERIEPPALKGLLNREARAKERYDEARRRLLGIQE